jgi:hypothetical protein
VKRLFVAAALVASCSGAKAPHPVAQTPIEVGTSDAGAPVATASAGPARDPRDPEDPPPSEKENRAVARTLEKVSELRGLKATRVVPGVKLTRERLAARVKEKALREYPPEALRREGLVLQLMGFAPSSFDYLGEMMHLLEAQLEGFYEPKNGTMYLASELKGAEAKATLAHELVHALQDMRWDLKSRSLYKPGKGDESLAMACVAEGDATSLMMDFVMAPKTALDLPEEMLREMMREGMSMGDLKTVPHVLKSSLVAPYVEGMAFVQALRRKGGWPMVDRAWDRLPRTTEQVLHVDKWESDEAALTLPAPTAAALGAGWKKDDEDTFGELGFALTFEEWMGHDDAHAAAKDWGGDRTGVFSRGEEIALAVHERYDAAPGKNAAAHAERALQTLGPALKKKLGAAAIDAGKVLCFERTDTGPLLFAQKDRELVMIAGPAKASKASWTSAANCATARKWAEEILAQK